MFKRAVHHWIPCEHVFPWHVVPPRGVSTAEVSDTIDVTRIVVIAALRTFRIVCPVRLQA